MTVAHTEDVRPRAIEPSRTVVAAAVLVAAAVVLVAVLALLVHNGVGDWRFDRRVLHAFRRQHSPVVRQSARVLADLGTIQSLIVFGLLITVGLVALRLRPVLCAVPLTALILTGAFVQLVKTAIPRSSPNSFFRTGAVGGVSFPSGHAADTTALAVGLAIVLAVTLARGRGERIALFGAAAGVSIAVGVSRLVLGVHWPTDVVAGWAIGLATAVVVGTLAMLTNDGSLGPTLRGLLARGEPS